MSAVAAPSRLLFDPTEHRYTLDGRVVPGVTEALKVVSGADYLGVDPEVLANAAARGTAVHRMVELDGQGVLDEAALDPDLQPYLVGWRRFLRESGLVVLAQEHRVASRRYGYAGTLDIFGVLNGRFALIDVKSVAMVMRSTGPQTAAYETALREWSPELLPGDAPVDRFALQLRPGQPTPYSLVPFPSRRDARTFLAALECHNFKRGA